MRRHRHHLRQRDEPGGIPAATPVGDGVPARSGPDDVLVTVAPTVAERHGDLGAVLGPGFFVEPGVPAAGAVAVLRAASPTTVAFWRARYPDAALLVVDPFRESPAVDCLEAGADDYVAGAVTTAELAARVRSLARRIGAVRVPA